MLSGATSWASASVRERHILELAHRLRISLSQPCTIDGTDIEVTASIGVAFAEPELADGELLRNADLAMYRAKSWGKDRVELYAPHMQDEPPAPGSLYVSGRLPSRSNSNTLQQADRMVRLAREKRQHALWMTGLYLGSVISVTMLVAGTYVARDSWWLSLILCGPSLVAMGKLYVLRRSDPDDVKAVCAATRSATNAGQQAQPPPVP